MVDQLDVSWGDVMATFVTSPSKHMIIASALTNLIGVWHVDLDVRALRCRTVGAMRSGARVSVCVLQTRSCLACECVHVPMFGSPSHRFLGYRPTMPSVAPCQLCTKAWRLTR